MAAKAPPASPVPVEELLAQAEWLRRLALALTRDPAEASDLAQETMEAALQRPPREPGPLRPWLGGVLRNLVKMRARGGARRERREAASEPPAEPSPSPESLVERVQTQQLVARLVLELPEPFRQTLLLRYYEGLSAAEIARRLDLPAGTVRWRLKEALDRLRVTLDGEHGADRRRWMALLAPLAGAPLAAPVAATVVKGALLMKGTKIAAVVVLLLAALAGVGWRLGWLRGKPAPAVAAAGPGDAAPAGKPAPRAPADTTPRGAVAGGDALPALHDDDPRGRLRLEGLVVDDQERPVARALVAIDSHPPRVIEAGDDGSFVFDGLIARSYALEARAGGAYAGPVSLRLAEGTEPVIMRLRPAGRLDVEVRAAGGGGEPIAGAAVELRSTFTWNGSTGADGRVSFEGVGEAWLLGLRVSAPGYAPATLRIDASGDPARPQQQLVRLERGAPVTGRVVDEKGKPVAGARVLAVPASQPFPVVDPRRDGQLTDDAGRFRFDALAAGSWRFTAAHPAYAPGTSTPLVLDGASERSVDILLAAGGRVAGRVVAEDGKPVAAAEVRVVARGALEWRYARQAVTGDDGRFDITGLPRRPLEVVAAHAGAASAIAAADLAATPRVELTLSLDVTGAIAGVVVAPDGEPVGEAQIVVEPEWQGAAGEREAWQVRGVPRLLADSGGRFVAGGLPAGRYRVRAARPGAPADSAWLRPGVSAAVGDEQVRVVLPPDGRVRGRVVYADGTSPELFSVAIGPARPLSFAAKDGAFALDAPGGVFNVSIEGPALEPTLVAAVEIGAGEKDLGVITVKRGRAISGRVLDAEGAPVAGAAVAAGLLISGGGKELNIPDEGFGVKETETDADGRFQLTGFGEQAITIVAGKPGAGRSASLRVPRGSESVVLDLVLQPTGGLDGALTRGGQPLAETVVIANPVGASASNFFVISGADGRFAFDELSAGEYMVSAMIGGGGGKPKDMHARRVTVVAGARAELAIDVSAGQATLLVSVVTDEGAPVTAAGVYVVPGSIDDARAEALRRDGEGAAPLVPAGATVPLYQRMAMGGPARVAGLVPGPYTACVVPLPIDPNDPAAARQLRERMGELPMRCAQVTVTGQAEEQTLEVRVPAAWTKPAMPAPASP